MQTNGSYLTTSRGVSARPRRKNIHYRRPRARLRHGDECDIWGCVLGNAAVIIKSAPNCSVPIPTYPAIADAIMTERNAIINDPISETCQKSIVFISSDSHDK